MLYRMIDLYFQIAFTYVMISLILVLSTAQQDVSIASVKSLNQQPYPKSSLISAAERDAEAKYEKQPRLHGYGGTFSRRIIHHQWNEASSLLQIRASAQLVERRSLIDGWKCQSEWALERVKQFCEKSVYPWLVCVSRVSTPGDVTSALISPLNTKFYCTEGLHGSAILVDLLNFHQKYRIGVYKYAQTSLSDPVSANFDESFPLDEENIRAVMKFVKPQGEELNIKHALDKARTLLSKEVSRGRAMAVLESVPGIPLTPKWYDIKDLVSNRSHNISRNAFFMEYLKGLPGMGLLQMIVRSETVVMETAWEDIVRRYQRVLQTPQSIESRQHAIKAIKIAEAEILLRVRHRVSLLDSLYFLAEILTLKGISHCDFHMGNIMFLCSKHHSYAFVNKGALSGLTVYCPTKLHFSMDLLSQLKSEAWADELRSGLQNCKLDLAHMRAIDTSHSLNVSAVVNNFAAGTKNKIVFPCKIDRGRNDDIIELLKSTDLTLLLKTRRSEIRDVAPLLVDRWNSLSQKYRRNEPQMFNCIDSDPEMKSALEKFNTSLKKLDEDLMALHQAIMTESNVQSCDLMDREMPQDVVAKGFLNRSYIERLKARKGLPHQCSVAAAEKGIGNVRRIIGQHARLLKAKFAAAGVSDFKIFLNPPTSL